MKFLELTAILIFGIFIGKYTLTDAVPTTFTVVGLAIMGILWVVNHHMARKS